MNATYLPRKMLEILRVFALALLLATIALIGVPPRAANATLIRLYVNWDAPGANNGSSWTDAYTDLQSALDAAAGGGYDIWVAAGTYLPFRSFPPNRSDTFQLHNNVAVYGGFAGNETHRYQRNWNTNVTTLSGYERISWINYYAYHVVTSSGTDATAVLDGFTIAGGDANGTGNDGFGGGMLNIDGGPTVSNVIFDGNSATDAGGVYDYGGYAPQLTNVTFSGNSATNCGGGMGSNSAASNLTNVVFSANSASDGGGMCNLGGIPGFTNVNFKGNSATTGDGGGMYNNNSNPTLVNVVFNNNSASDIGGGMSDDQSLPTLRNVTFGGNSAGLYGGAISNIVSSTSTIVNSILWGNHGETVDQEIYNNLTSSASITYSDIRQNGYTGNHNINLDPKFVRNPAPPSDYGDLHLQPSSPAIDTGSNAAVPSGITTDLDGNKRIMGKAVDMGAYESFVKIFLPLIRK